ncbi:MAG: hypothetical protein K2Y71_11180 [Xanthobacteraceae bacterium]|nr:hypothetical protein [Xanthobacteraceae bacterium]
MGDKTWKGTKMRKLFLSLAAAAATMTGAALMPSNAGAAVVAPAAMQPAVEHTSMVDNVRWVRVCHHHWRTSHGHCGFVWRPGHWHRHHHFYHHHHRGHHRPWHHRHGHHHHHRHGHRHRHRH